VSAAGALVLDLSGGALATKYASLAGAEGLTFGGALTLALWVALPRNVTLPSATAALFHADDFGFGAAVSLQLDSNGTITALFKDGANVTLAEASAPALLAPTGAWTHLALTADAAGRLRLYANGTSVANSTGAPGGVPLQLRDFALLGLLLDGSGAPTGGVAPALLADVQLYDAALAPATVAALAAGRTAGCAAYPEYAPLAAPRSACWHTDARLAAGPAGVTQLNATLMALRNTGAVSSYFTPGNASYAAGGAALPPFAEFAALQLDGTAAALVAGAATFGVGSAPRAGVTVMFRTFLAALPPAPQYLFSFGTPDNAANTRIGQRVFATVGAAGELSVLYDLVSPVRAFWLCCFAVLLC
jgi:hypothetical protein